MGVTVLAQAFEASPEAASNGALAETIVFWVLAVVGVAAGIAMVTSRNIAHAALFLVVNFFAIAGLYLTLQSSFLSVVQILVYAGAIMVLFLFVIMLLGVDRDDLLYERGGRLQKTLGAIVGAAFAVMMLSVFVGPFTSAASNCGNQAEVEATGDQVACAGLEALVETTPNGSAAVIGERMFTRYTFTFETAALLLTVATLGALVLGRRHDPEREPDLVALAPDELEPTPAEIDDDELTAVDAAPLEHAQVGADGIYTTTRPTQDIAVEGREPTRSSDRPADQPDDGGA